MAGSVLRNKSKELAKEIIFLCKDLKDENKDSVLTNQLLSAGTMIGESIYEAQHIRGAKEFVEKLETAERECYATEYWLELLFETDYIDEEKFNSLQDTCGTIRRMITSSIEAVKKLERLISKIELAKDSFVVKENA